MEKNSTFQRKVGSTVFISLLIISGFALFVYHINFFLLVFAGVFFSVLLNYLSNHLSALIKLRYSLSLILVLLLMAGFIVGLVFLIGPSVSKQMREMVDKIPEMLNNLKDQALQTEIGQTIFKQIPEDPEKLVSDKGKVFSQLMGSFASFVGSLVNFFVIIVTGIFLASTPALYTKGFIKLFPVSFRDRLKEVMDKTHTTLSLWMWAKLISMAVVGVSSAIGLVLLDIPMPYALALIAAVFSFIPNIGPYLSLAPAVLVAFTQGADKALYVVILYFSIQIVESYLITPLIEKKMVSLPPALTLFWQIIMALMTGIIGIMLAAPILAAIMVIVGELYIKDYLEKGK